MPGSTLSLKNLTIDYGPVRAVDALSLDMQPGEVVALLGPSGCGKTTTLRAIAGLQRVTTGEIRIDDERVDDVPPHKRDIGLVFQNYALFPHRTVAENIAFGLKMTKGLSRESRSAKIDAALALLQVSEHADKFPNQLSGGQQQRVALARSLVTEPRLLLLDEALSALDKKLRDEMRVEIRRLIKRVGITTVIVTHDQDEALVMSDRIALMRNGRIEQIGTPEEIYYTPISQYVAEFIGEINTIAGVVVDVKPDEVAVQVAGGDVVNARSGGVAYAPSDPVFVCFRPEMVSIAPAHEQVAHESANAIAGHIENTQFIGEKKLVTVRRADGSTVQCRLSGQQETETQPGAPVILTWAAQNTHCYRQPTVETDI